VGLRGGWRALLALGLLRVTCAEGAIPGELRTIGLRSVDDGTAVVLRLSRPATPQVAVVRGEDGALRRLHLDLPSRTTVAAGALGGGAAERPVASVRVGVVDGDHPRIVVDLDGATDYRVARDDAHATITLTVVGPKEPGASAAEHPLRKGGRRPDAPVKIVLDPGHGGDDPGAEGFAVEKAVTLDIAERLATLLRNRLGAEVVLTRDGDDTLALKERTARANAEGADLFVSIHANANTTGRLQGIETYYLDNSTDHATLRLAQMENGLDLLKPRPGEASLRYILSDLVQVGKLDESVRLARQIQRGLVGHLRREYTGVVDLGVKRGPFYVLVGAYMPCVLVETAFISHPIEGRRLARGVYRRDVAQGLFDGIARYLRDGSRRRTL
jgi:N-acetylmuramoyl-L-alanine amidase